MKQAIKWFSNFHPKGHKSNNLKSMGENHVNHFAMNIIYLLFVVFLISNNSQCQEMPVSELFDKVKGDLVLIECNTRSGVSHGSGFILGQWLVTNEHVIRDARSIIAHSGSGKEIAFEHFTENENVKNEECVNKKRKVVPKNKPEKRDPLDGIWLETARDRDLARIRVASPSDALKLSAASANIGCNVWTFGNSDGSGVLTSLRGKIIGVGPDKIEVNIPFVHGNSGGAIITTEGTVCGVATYATLSNDTEDWLKQGTRFTEVRRFGLTLDDVQWVRISWNEYVKRCIVLADIKAMNDILIKMALRPWPLDCFSTYIHESQPAVIGNGFFSKGYDITYFGLKNSRARVYKHPGEKALRKLSSEEKQVVEQINDSLVKRQAAKAFDADLQFALTVNKAMETKEEEESGKRRLGGTSTSTVKSKANQMLSERLKTVNAMRKYMSQFKAGSWKAYNMEVDFLIEEQLLDKVHSYYTEKKEIWSDWCMREVGL